MDRYTVTGMSCAACSSRVEKAVSSVKGVRSCSVNLLTNQMSVDGNAMEEDVIRAVEAAGYGAYKEMNGSISREIYENTISGTIRKRLISSVILLVMMLYISMGYCMFGWPLPEFLMARPISLALIELVLAVAVIIINQAFFIGGFKSLFHRNPNMDTLVALGSSAAFLYSVCVVLIMMNEQETGRFELVEQHLRTLYFDTSAMILTLITVGKLLESKAKGRTTDALKKLIQLAPVTATVLRNGKEEKLPVKDLQVDEIFLVKPGEGIPVDGMVLEGVSSVNESAITGESIPRDVTSGDSVKSGTSNYNGFLKCRATAVGEDTTIARIINLVQEASATKAPIAKSADRAASIFVPLVLAIAAVTILVWLITGRNVGYALARGISVLVISCPCAMGLATPVAIMVGSGVGARNGILFKDAQSLEITGKTEIICLDKTGTITTGQPVVTDFIPAEGLEEVMVRMVYALESRSEHPLGMSIVQYLKQKYPGLEYSEAVNYRAIPGIGASAVIEDAEVSVGNYANTLENLGEEGIASFRKVYDACNEAGKTTFFFRKDRMLLGMAAISDSLKPDSARAVKELKALGLKVVMLTGDHGRAASFIGEKAGVDRVVSNVLPDEKENTVKGFMCDDKGMHQVAMVGDGINDAPALTRADVGIAIGAGTDIAIDSADVVLLKSNLLDVPGAIRLSRKVLCNIKQNLFWALIYNAICIPLAAGVFVPAWGWEVSPAVCAIAMSISSICVVLNSLRLNSVQIHDASKDRAIVYKQVKNQENISMNKTIKIQGMMCPHCEARVKSILEEIDGVESAKVSHVLGNAELKLDKEVSDEVIRKAVEGEGYYVSFE